MAMLIGMVLYQETWYIVVLFVICIFASIMAVFSWQSEQRSKYPFLALFVMIAVFWNPIFRLNEGFDPAAQWWLLIQTAASAIFFLGAFMVKTPSPTR